MSTPQGPENPQGSSPYPEPYYVPGQDGGRPEDQPGWERARQEQANDQQSYSGYPQGGYPQGGFPQGGGYQQGGGYYQQGGGYYQQGGGYQAGAGYPGPGGYPGGTPRPIGYLEGSPVGFSDAVRGGFSHMFTYRGRASRSAFWWFALLEVIAYFVVGYISARSTAAGVILDIVIGIPMILAGIALAVRRLHDADHSGWWWWIGFVPLVGWIVLLVFYLLPGTPGPNRYSYR